MTITSTTSRWNYVADGVSVEFVYDNKILAASDLIVTVAGVVKALVADYSVTGVRNNNGGKVVFNLPPGPAGALVQLVRNVPAIQPVNLVDGDDFPPEVINDEFDRLTILVQQGTSAAERTLRQPPSDTALVGFLPPKATRAAGGGGGFFTWDANGDPAVQPVAGLASVPVSPAMAPIVGAPSIPAALAGLTFSPYSQTLAPLVDAAAYRAALQIAPTIGGNLFVNGGQRLDQRREGGLSGQIGISPAEAYLTDRWVLAFTGGMAGKGQRLSAAPAAGMGNYLRISVDVVKGVLAANDYAAVAQRIEGFRSARLKWGTALGQPVALQFRVRASVPGQYGGALRNQPITRSLTFGFNIAAANVWQDFALLLPGDVAGAWQTGNGSGVECWFCMGAGATYLLAAAGGFANANALTVPGQVNMFATAGATFDIGDLKLEPGTVNTPFDLAGPEAIYDAQRYFWKTHPEGTPATFNTGMPGCFTFLSLVGSVANGGNIRLPRPMRTTPTLTAWNPLANNNLSRDLSGGADIGVVTMSGAIAGTTGFHWNTGNITVGNSGGFHITADAEL